MTNRELLDEVNDLPGERRARIRRRLKDAGMMAAGLLAVLALSAAAPIDTRAAGWESLGTFKTTGYCNCRKCAGRWAGGATASGAMPEEGVTIAVDRSVIPLGAHILIDGHEFVAQDTGVRGKHIDVYYEDHDDARDHGTQHKQVFIWRED